MCSVPDDAAVNGAETGVFVGSEYFLRACLECKRECFGVSVKREAVPLQGCRANKEGPFSQSLYVRRWLTESETVRRRGKPMAGS